MSDNQRLIQIKQMREALPPLTSKEFREVLKQATAETMYPEPGFYSSRNEVLALARVTADHRGGYVSHIRSEDRSEWARSMKSSTSAVSRSS